MQTLAQGRYENPRRIVFFDKYKKNNKNNIKFYGIYFFT